MKPRDAADRKAGERMTLRDTTGNLKYLGHAVRYKPDGTPCKENGMRMQCLCGVEVVWSKQETARRRRRWARLNLTAQCPECERNARAKGPTKETLPAWARGEDDEAITRARGVWHRLSHGRIHLERNHRQFKTGLADRVRTYVDPLQYHVDRRWTAVFEGNPDPFEEFLRDMGPPTSALPYLLRRDSFAAFTKANCFWGGAEDRRVTRADNPDALRSNNVDIAWVVFFGKDKATPVPYSVVQGSVNDPQLHRGIGTVQLEIRADAYARPLPWAQLAPPVPTTFDAVTQAHLDALATRADMLGINRTRGLRKVVTHIVPVFDMAAIKAEREAQPRGDVDPATQLARLISGEAGA